MEYVQQVTPGPMVGPSGSWFRNSPSFPSILRTLPSSSASDVSRQKTNYITEYHLETLEKSRMEYVQQVAFGPVVGPSGSWFRNSPSFPSMLRIFDTMHVIKLRKPYPGISCSLPSETSTRTKKTSKDASVHEGNQMSLILATLKSHENGLKV